MRNLKNYMMCLAMIIPMLVLLAHDIIPHNHHLHQIDDHNHVSVIQVHQHLYEHSHANTHQHNGIHWNHSHEANAETCCILTHNRVQKDNAYKVFLQSDNIQLDCEETQKLQSFNLRNQKLTPEPIRFIPHRRGPPNSFLA
ncbi:hypothetical protein [Marinifilum sp. D714]|uniref:hypothetical protein n=1 Tax=Marinifilum sp. D714 TaxID=2937523 RepID=UPI0027CB4340|nr:hypothetical protein [Marinifilum sp. D714]MDQ2177150.1 hypothetical protein [Marinifilum sp. D714]